MTIADIIREIELTAPLSLQEAYDNAGLLTGSPAWECRGVLSTLDVTPEVVDEAVARGCNCIVAHHPLIFRGLKKLTGQGAVERAVIKAVKADIAIYAAHTNLDNVIRGVNGKIADKLGLTGRQVLMPRQGALRKLFTFVPPDHLEKVRDALFRAGGGHISDYSECSFTSAGKGTFRPGPGTDPYIGEKGQRKETAEVKLELILPAHLEQILLQALFAAHPYEEVAYDMVPLTNAHADTGAGLIGQFPQPISEKEFLSLLTSRFGLQVLRHTAFTGRPLSRVALCGGAGSFLISRALSAGADAFVTADLKYHEFFEADGRMLICDIGHYESEQFTTELLIEILLQKFPTFAVLKSEVGTNPVRYFSGK